MERCGIHRHGIEGARRTLPRSPLIGTTVVTLLYILLNLSYLLVVSTEDLSGVEQVGYLVATKLWGTGVRRSFRC